jgi:hypothetical protein
MGFIVAIDAEDGRHAHFFNGEHAAIAGYEDQIGRKLSEKEIDQWNNNNRLSKSDDWGRRISISPAPYNIKSAKGYLALVKAYDNRECGIDTAKDRRMLEDAGW